MAEEIVGGTPFTEADFTALANIMRAATGVALAPEKREMVYGRLNKRVRALGLTCFREYVLRLEGPDGPAEMQRLINALTTNLTRFFREPHHFEDLAGHFKDCRANGQRRFRVWSAACSTGEEAYSIVAALLDAGASRHDDVRVLATDIDTDVLARARAGIYPASNLANAPEHMQKRFALRGDSASASPDMQALVAFKQLNLLGDWPMSGPFDAIFCRNVFIYFEQAVQAAIARRMVALLSPGGRLYIGHAETLRDPMGLALSGITTYTRAMARAA